METLIFFNRLSADFFEFLLKFLANFDCFFGYLRLGKRLIRFNNAQQLLESEKKMNLSPTNNQTATTTKQINYLKTTGAKMNSLSRPKHMNTKNPFKKIKYHLHNFNFSDRSVSHYLLVRKAVLYQVFAAHKISRSHSRH